LHMDALMRAGLADEARHALALQMAKRGSVPAFHRVMGQLYDRLGMKSAAAGAERAAEWAKAR